MSSSLPPEELIALMALSDVKTVGHYTAKTLISYSGNAADVFKQSKSKLLKIPGISEATIQNILDYKEFDQFEKEVSFIEKHGIKAMAYYQKDYPYRLKDIPDAPVLLFSLGECDLNEDKMIGIVGTRKNTLYGKTFTEKLVEELAPYQVTIISGMAYGVDICAHKAALKNKIKTAGVFGHGLDRVYPAAHTNTAKQMLKQGGALIAEHISGTTPDRENFPKRNRIVAGLIDALVVVETDLKGGSMITAKLALGYDREVLALPGRIDDGYSKGCNYLIKSQQATMIESAEDLVKLLNWDLKDKPRKPQISLPLDLSQEQKLVFGLIKAKGSISLDLLIARTEMSSSKLAFILLELEFRSLILSLPGKVYQCIH